MIDTARGVHKADLVFKGGTILNVFANTMIQADVAISKGVIVGIGNYSGVSEIDIKGKYITPGFIDAHLHLESTMVEPATLIYQASKQGTTTFIVDPHEAANVSGSIGIDYILSHTQACHANVYVMMPSCVPATDFEDNGCTFGVLEMEQYKDNKRVLGLGEVMDCQAVLSYKSDMIEKLHLFKDRIIDGHAAGLSEHDLNAYILSGIRTNHEYYDFEDALLGLQNGMNILIREGSAAKNLSALVKGIIDSNIATQNFAFCTDDKHIEEIIRDGHISTNIRKSIALGLNVFEAYKMATIYPAKMYNLKTLGAIAPGYQADLVILDDLKHVKINSVYHKGKRIVPELCSIPINEKLLDTIHIKDSDSISFSVNKDNEMLDVLDIIDGQILTNHRRISPSEVNDYFQTIAVVERHNNTGKYGVGLVSNFGIKNGAIASSVSHDSHNIVLIGDNEDDMHIALKELIRTNGGYTLVKNGVVLATLPLPIMGLISDKPYEEVHQKLKEMLDIAYNEMHINRSIDPFITLSFLALPVIPQIRITARGMYDVVNHKFLTP